MRVPLPVTGRTNPSSTALLSPSGAGGTPEAFGAGIGRGLANAAQGLGQLTAAVKTQEAATKRFTALRNFSTFQTNVGDKLTELQQNSDPAQANFTEQAEALYTNEEAAFLNTLDPELQEEFSVLTAGVKQTVHTNSMTFQLESTKTYFTDQMNDAFTQAKVALSKNGSVENLDLQRVKLDEMLALTTLGEAEKVQLRRQIYAGLESVAYKEELTKYYLDREAQGPGGSARRMATDLLRDLEGAMPGEESRTFEENQQILDERIRASEARAVQQLGNLDRWAAMPDRARAGLIAVISEKGELPENVLKAIRSGNLDAVADAVAALGGRNTAVAEVIRGNEEMPEAQLDADPRFANVSYEDRLAIRQDAETEARAQLNAQTAQQKAEGEALINALHVGLMDGTAGQLDIDTLRERGVLTDVDDITKARELLKKYQGDVGLVAQGWTKVKMGGTFNPASTEDKDTLNAMVGKEGIAAIDALDAEYTANTLIPLVRLAQDLPTDVAGMLTGMIHSVDQEKALWALDLAAQLQEASPAGFALRTTETPVASDVEFWRQHKDSWAPEQILEALRGGTLEQRGQKDALRNEAFARMSNAQDTQAFVTPDLLIKEFTSGGFFGIGATVPQLPNLAFVARGMESEFRTLVADEYVKDGDMALAQRRALDALHRVWGVTDVGGETTLMKLPPQMAGYKPFNGSYDYITEQVRSEMALPPGSTLQLISDAQTKAETVAFGQGGSEPPSYMVVWTDVDGVMHDDRDENGVPLRRFFEMDQSKQDLIDMADYQRRNERIELETTLEVYTAAYEHSLETGTPIPDEIQNKYSRLFVDMGRNVFGRPVL